MLTEPFGRKVLELTNDRWGICNLFSKMCNFFLVHSWRRKMTRQGITYRWRERPSIMPWILRTNLFPWTRKNALRNCHGTLRLVDYSSMLAILYVSATRESKSVRKLTFSTNNWQSLTLGLTGRAKHEKAVFRVSAWQKHLTVWKFSPRV